MQESKSANWRRAVSVTIRRMRPADQPQAEALWRGLSPYRPGDEPEVEAMYERALHARDAGDSRWKSLDAMESDDHPPNCLENWVAVVPSGSGEDRVVGTVQVVCPTALSEMPTDHPLSHELCLRDDVAELRLMRVAEEVWRQGIGTRLTEVAIDWCRDHRIRTLILNTTSPQKPAIGLTTSSASARRPERSSTGTSWSGYGLSCEPRTGVLSAGQLTSDSTETGVGATGSTPSSAHHSR